MPLEDRIRNLPPKLRTEVEDFVNFLTDQNTKVSSGILKQQWAGMLQDAHLGTAVELQKKLLK